MSTINASVNTNSASVNANSASVATMPATTDRILTPVAAPVETARPVTQVSRTELQQAVDVVNQAVALEQRSLSFSIDDLSGRSVIKVVDFETDELIKQIPTEELLKVAQDIKRLQDEMGQSIGLLIDNKV
ncbi:flagellar protein FlaG [Arsukibacterium indicum]|uniref:Flagellar protein FlaG n=1 Tax=Arsukibacterium indicum TaxID=2848612 RepID=A0ABS6MGH0_9GAMM|nr:flagellar protein FlaG [Arsukibacterium indicum]MBV2127883.1 flagellar protein FlaG [Arsukibacterium indicum]